MHLYDKETFHAPTDVTEFYDLDGAERERPLFRPINPWISPSPLRSFGLRAYLPGANEITAPPFPKCTRNRHPTAEQFPLGVERVARDVIYGDV